MNLPSRLTPSRNKTTARQRGVTPKLPRAAELKYIRSLRAIMRAVHATYMRDLAPLIEERAGERKDALGHGVEAIALAVHAQLSQRVAKAFDTMAASVKRTNPEPIKGIRPSELGVDKAITEARRDNIALVEKAHRVYADDVREVMNDPATFGKRVEDIRDDLLSRGRVSESRAELIARDQTLKLNGAINQARQTDAGVDSYEWSTSLDERVRDSHAAHEGQVFQWSDPPEETGHPGEDYQCRCIAIPIIPGLEGLDATD